MHCTIEYLITDNQKLTLTTLSTLIYEFPFPEFQNYLSCDRQRSTKNFVFQNKRVAPKFKSVQITTTSTHVPHGPEHILTGITRKPCFLICFITYTPNPISITDSIGLGHLQIVFNQQVFGIHSAKILHFEKIALDIEVKETKI